METGTNTIVICKYLTENFAHQKQEAVPERGGFLYAIFSLYYSGFSFAHNKKLKNSTLNFRNANLILFLHIA